MTKKENLFTVIIFIAVIFAGGISFLVCKDRDFSDNENRMLAKSPKLTATALVSGKYMADFDEYVSDQFPLRDGCMGIATGYKRLLGMKDVNGVYIGKDGYLLTKIDEAAVDSKRVEKNIRYFNEFFAKHQEKNISFMLVPEASMVLSDKLPAKAEVDWEWELLSKIRTGIEDAEIIKPENAMMNSDLQMYYRTDHHWTGYGAYEAYKEFSGKTTGTEFKVVTDEFLGSLYSKVLSPDIQAEEIVVGTENMPILADGKEIMLYDEEALLKKDKYQVFQGGNHGMVKIEGKGEGNILIIKDSFANSFVPFLVEDYGNIIMVDLRYYMGNMNALCASEEITDILVLYQIGNFITDENIIKLGL